MHRSKRPSLPLDASQEAALLSWKGAHAVGGTKGRGASRLHRYAPHTVFVFYALRSLTLSRSASTSSSVWAYWSLLTGLCRIYGKTFGIQVRLQLHVRLLHHYSLPGVQTSPTYREITRFPSVLDWSRNSYIIPCFGLVQKLAYPSSHLQSPFSKGKLRNCRNQFLLYYRNGGGVRAKKTPITHNDRRSNCHNRRNCREVAILGSPLRGF